MRPFLLLAFYLLMTGATFAQTRKAAPAPSADAKAVEAAVVRFFDAMRTSDSTMARSVLADNARLMSVGAGKDGKILPRETPMNKFVEMIGQHHPQVLDERIWDVKVNIDGDLATLWCEYAFYVGDTFSHCGVDAFQLYRSPEGWKIFTISDTRRKENCDLKAAQAAKSKR
ncbi:nuclear transport factor 2 family protein [Rufibacter sediminis]|uniref:Nuclear transport factor 2 family protein n=1 Tax=Rufibacter sediminis TaxID=2762756 RepID=A0ABR6VXZ5_9BACT|nr:nuclear transport factor 2 family protein [Rufibacter sediminis]MBC3542041.1 nuclear transport factor 2 family protein [Rufibacter sediminis]